VGGSIEKSLGQGKIAEKAKAQKGLTLPRPQILSVQPLKY
jgi:hypothetical protein